MSLFLRKHAAKLVAAAAIIGTFAFVMQPSAASGGQQHLAAQFGFTELAVPQLEGRPTKTIRAVHPDLQRIDAWISSVGAGVALHDLDGDGLPNDLCLIDPRTDTAMVAPAPGTAQRYQPFALEPGALPYDARTMAPTGCLPGDINEDGKSDIIVYFWGRAPIAYLQTATMSFQPQEIVGPEERWFTNAGTLADLDGDGHLDLLIGNYFPDGSRILDANATERSFMQRSMSRAFNGGGPHFLLSTGGGKFTWVKDVLSGPEATGWTLAIGAADLDGDLLPEVYVSNDFGPDRILANGSTPGQLKFTPAMGKQGFATPGSYVIGHDSFKGMGIDFADINEDGAFDLAVSNISSAYGLIESHFLWQNTGDPKQLKQGIAPYANRSDKLGLSYSGWGWDIKMSDFNNDGTLEVIQATGFVKGETNRWPEMHEVATGNDTLLEFTSLWPRLGQGSDLSGSNRDPFWVKGANGRYVDVAAELGMTEARVTRGIAIADVDGDGALDYATATQWGDSYLQQNQCPGCGQSLGLHLRLPLAASGTVVEAGHVPTVPSRAAVGAHVKVTLPNGRTLVTQVDGGNGHSGKRAPDAFFGLGDLAADATVKVEVMYRDPLGKVQKESFTVKPGWHTVLLGWTEGGK